MILFITIIIFLIIFYILVKKTWKKIKININNRYYYVNDFSDKYSAGLLLNLVYDKISFLINSIEKTNYNFNKTESKHYEKIKNELINSISDIKLRWNNIIISESDIESNDTSYTINKGDEMIICIRNNGEFSDLNTLLYVVIHELAHIGCDEIGHTDKFYIINKFLLEEAIKNNIYKYEDYSINNKWYCGITISSNVLNM